jgi:hypothetical protein
MLSAVHRCSLPTAATEIDLGNCSAYATASYYVKWCVMWLVCLIGSDPSAQCTAYSGSRRRQSAWQSGRTPLPYPHSPRCWSM